MGNSDQTTKYIVEVSDNTLIGFDKCNTSDYDYAAKTFEEEKLNPKNKEVTMFEIITTVLRTHKRK